MVCLLQLQIQSKSNIKSVVKQMNKKSTEKVKKQRKDLQTIKKGYADKELRNEKVPSYIAGGY